MRKDLRVAYLSSLGFREVQTINALEAVLKENEIDKIKLGKICEHYQIPVQYRSRVWKIMLGVLPQYQEAWEYIQSQKETQYSDLKQACEVVDSQAHSLFHKVKWSTFARRTKLHDAKAANNNSKISPSSFSPTSATPPSVDNIANYNVTPAANPTSSDVVSTSAAPLFPSSALAAPVASSLLSSALNNDEKNKSNNSEEKNKKGNNDTTPYVSPYTTPNTTPLKRTISGVIHAAPKTALAKSPKHKSSPSFSPSPLLPAFTPATPSSSVAKGSLFSSSKHPPSPFSSTSSSLKNISSPFSSTPIKSSTTSSSHTSTPASATKPTPHTTPLTTPTPTPTTTPTTSPTFLRPSPPPSPYSPDLELLLTDAALMLSLLFSTKRSYFDLSSSPSSPESVKMDDEMCIHGGEEFKDDSGHITAIAKVFCAICDTENDAFWCFHDFLNQPLQIYGHRSIGIYRYISILSRLIESNDAELWQHLKAVDLRLEQFAYCWFKSYFTSCFSMPSLSIIWDKIIGISLDCMPHIAFSILQALRRRILRKPDSQSIANMLIYPNVAIESFLHKAIDMYSSAPTTNDEHEFL